MKRLLLWAFVLGILFGVFDYLIAILRLYVPPKKPEEFPILMYFIRNSLFATAVCLPKAIIEKSIRLVGKALLFGVLIGIIQILLPFITMSGEVVLFVLKWTLGFLAGSMSSDSNGATKLYSRLGGLIGGSVNLNLWLALFALPVSARFWSVLLVAYYGTECASYWFFIATAQRLGERRHL